MVFAGATYKLHLDMKLLPHLPGLSHLDTSAWTRNYASIYRDLGKNNATAMQTATNQTAGPLGFIAGANRHFVHLGKFIMTFNSRLPIEAHSSPNFILTCPACPTLLANNNSRFCINKNIQNRPMSIICKFSRPCSSLLPSHLPGLKTATKPSML
jgi:hypothetical protein